MSSIFKTILFISLVLSTIFVIGQNNTTYILSGTVVDGSNNEPLAQSNIIIDNKGTSTNMLGEFSVQVKENDTLNISYIGYQTLTFVAPKKDTGMYLIKFKLYKDSISLKEVEIFPWPTYEEFKKAFVELDKSDEQIDLNGVKQYKGEPIKKYVQPSVFSPISFVYDRLFDKKAKQIRILKKHRKKIDKSWSE